MTEDVVDEVIDEVSGEMSGEMGLATRTGGNLGWAAGGPADVAVASTTLPTTAGFAAMVRVCRIAIMAAAATGCWAAGR